MNEEEMIMNVFHPLWMKNEHSYWSILDENEWTWMNFIHEWEFDIYM
jgi:hypothetical protein